MKNCNSTPANLYDTEIDSPITFKSESDALFAAFCLGDQLGCKLQLRFPTRIINAFIGFLKHPRFHGDQLTFMSTSDMIDSITKYREDAINKKSRNRREAALQRREIALKHPTPYYGDMLAGNVCRIVLELVAEELAHSATPLQICGRSEANGCQSIKKTLEQRALQNMCLVHRSWKAITQEFLACSLVVQSNAEIYDFMASPLMGPSIRHLCYHFAPDMAVFDITQYSVTLQCNRCERFNRYTDFSEDNTVQNQDDRGNGYEDGVVQDNEDEGDHFVEPILMPEQARNLSHVLSVCTGIRVLQIHGSLYMSETGSEPFDRIAQLQNLEVLSLGDIRSERFEWSNTLLYVCIALPNMQRLKSLTLFRFMCPTGQVIPPFLDELSPPSSLTDVEVHMGWGSYGDNKETEVLLSWLFRPREAYSVLSTALVGRELFKHNDLSQTLLYRALRPALSSLEAITLEPFRGMTDRDMADTLSTCTRLRAVRITECFNYEKLDYIPSIIEKLRIDDNVLLGKHVHIEAIIGKLRKLPNLRSLYIVGSLQIEGKIALELYCSENGIEFSRRDIMEDIWYVIPHNHCYVIQFLITTVFKHRW